ncbi:MAG TPA: O-antigen ligase family protein [Opitutaceae bacterium]|nr:O-antigen ligase family protein [Opitutaceae bacterium]
MSVLESTTGGASVLAGTAVATWSEAEPRRPSIFWSGTAWVSFSASFLTAFTLPIIGKMPVGEIPLTAAALWALTTAAVNQAWPGALLRQPLFRRLLVAQGIAFLGYIVSDLYRHSAPHDIERGWGRMVLLAIDILGVAYLFGRSPRNLVVFVVGGALGEVASAWLFGPLFGDMWKFGVGAPLTDLVFLVAPMTGAVGMSLAAAGIGAVHFLLDYRSFGGVCIVAGTVCLLLKVRPVFRLWLAPLFVALAALACLWFFDGTRSRHRTTRSDIERQAMMTAAFEAVERSPLIGHGSWFSNSDVYDNFMRIRFAMAREAHVGGFADPNKRPDDMALHSQLLVALAEGGLFGGAFFLLFGVELLRALCRLAIVGTWHRLAPLYVLLLLSALWNLCFSPFSGAHRVYIATACGLLLMLRDGRPRAGLAFGDQQAVAGSATPYGITGLVHSGPL